MVKRMTREERAYRRGFDQGVYAGMRALGLSDKETHQQPIKEWAACWRRGQTGPERPIDALPALIAVAARVKALRADIEGLEG